ncbi:MAG: cytochrome [Bdellovibrionales bacterium]|jgi:hypothetical protein|nr:cytochrome [Bdellovibrionales bacterium]MBK8204636.1 cytochrome [Bdellovibrionales bacterium]MBK9040272.1 cytochrome [Bdellovibrionales bacterium]
MYLQGNLQQVFDALYELGIIDPVLQMDWGQALEQMPHHLDHYHKAIGAANLYQDDKKTLMDELKKLNESALKYLAMEVAREYADFHAREILH